jgi:hypothetical protein
MITVIGMLVDALRCGRKDESALCQRASAGKEKFLLAFEIKVTILGKLLRPRLATRGCWVVRPVRDS